MLMPMRPSELDPLFAPLSRLKGVGPKLGDLFDILTGRAPEPSRIVDLLFHLPVDCVNRSLSHDIASSPTEGIITIKGVVEAHRPAPVGRARAPHRVVVGDFGADVTLVFFRLPRAQIEAMLPLGAERVISGKVELFDGVRQMVHPDRVLSPDRFAEMGTLEPVYPLTEGLTSRRVQMVAQAALERLPTFSEWQDAPLLESRGWPSFKDALSQLHAPQNLDQTSAESPAYQRLAYDELLASQLALQLVRARFRESAGRRTKGDGRLREAILEALPYQLTGAQTRALATVAADMAEPKRMLRLVQGDVGAGKTIVALLSMAIAVEAGRQAALMAPTEILARQHFERLAPIAQKAGIRLALLTGRAGAVEKRDILKRLVAHEIDILIGTHAVFQDEVIFADLALAVVDEQHRFGVNQRLALAGKGDAVDLLIMTATPIPRTLMLGYFGDLDVCALDEKPPGRKPIDTRIVSNERMGEMIDSLARAISKGARVYWVCPLVGTSEKLDLAAAEERFSELSQIFPGRVGLVHGKMPGAVKDATINGFARGDLSILVATTVIEVGVDVPEATIMVIEEAQRFGLAQLHQLRGRVGRGAEKSTAILLYRGPLSETARARLGILRETEDGFRIAEEDLRLRGEGDLLGTRQSGVPGFRIARLDLHQALLRIARDDAVMVLSRDPELVSARGMALRNLLYLFERQEAIDLMKAG